MPNIRGTIGVEAMTEPLAGIKGELAGLKNKKVLIVEDDKFLRYLLTIKLEQLKDRGVQVFTTGDTEEALETARKVNPDVIFLDIVMPGKNGYEFLKELREEIQFRETPVIILSNLTNQDNNGHMKGLNVSAYLVKADFALNDLVEKVSDILANVQSPQPTTA
ncbi:response regulator [Candidatus Parcubacteria bacterium]|nr:MAG: response regulator [Candidatus Parcubacteria bacterium]